IEELQKEAYDAGLKQGVKQAQTDFGSAQTALTLLCDQLSTIRETILKNSKDEMVELVIALSEKIIRHSVTEQHQTIVDTVDSAIHQAVKSSEFYIYVHPEDLSIIQDHTQSFISGLNGLENIVVKADPGIERGGCRIESDNSTVDATIGSQFAVLKDSIREKKRST
ncbi:MAG: FliH/SctL family protein, partial [Desulfocapsaceae bacterium]|nr:FliH/SctL family protein [Desulfocapsaceae bacterium]